MEWQIEGEKRTKCCTITFTICETSVEQTARVCRQASKSTDAAAAVTQLLQICCKANVKLIGGALS